jgi:hypothetical protein
VLAAYGVVKLMNARRRKMKQIRESLKNKNNNNNDEVKKVADKMHVKEWLHENTRRPVKVTLNLFVGSCYSLFEI